MSELEIILIEMEDDFVLVDDLEKAILRLHVEKIFTMGRLAQLKEDRNKS